MYLSADEHRALATCFSLLAEDLNERELRDRIGRTVLDLFRADHFASYVWLGDVCRFDGCVSLHMDPANLGRYETHYQYHDPITFLLQSRRHATLVSEVIPRRELLKTAFFNDFLARDGLHWGINLHAFEGDEALGDLRVWRGRSRGDFAEHDRQLLNLIEPAFTAALRRARRTRQPAESADSELSPRELAVARCVGRGLTDKQIARELGISAPSVRTYLRRVFAKLEVTRRSGIAHALSVRH
ncbi:helix-turn-helix transcriptional regulator [Ottowia sp.]|uniref:helix-turn-helix transcriptional regulator n=1 Tax=Ottowia sp. TaxID=1898956 RepID=UPI0039E598D2